MYHCCRASPRLKDADIPEALIPNLYVELLLMVRKMFLECKLVHADLSEYNILYHVEETPLPDDAPPIIDASTLSPGEAKQAQPVEDAGENKSHLQGHLYIIDVSQSVEQDHPHAFDFLRSDLHNVEDFFSKRGAPCIGLRRVFEFVTRESLGTTEEDPATTLRRWMDEPDEIPIDGEDRGEAQRDAAQEDAVFRQSYIPRTLNEVYDPERDVGALRRGEGAQLIYKDVIGLVTADDDDGVGKSASQAAVNGNKVRFQDDVSPASREGGGGGEGSSGREDASEDGEDSSDSESDGEKHGLEERQPRGHRHEDKEAKKVCPIVFLPHGIEAGTGIPRGSLFVIAGLISVCRNARRRRRRRHARSASTRCLKRRRNGKSRRPHGGTDRREGQPAARPSRGFPWWE